MDQEMIKDAIVEALAENRKNKESAEKENSFFPRLIECVLVFVVFLIPVIHLISKPIIEIEGQHYSVLQCFSDSIETPPQNDEVYELSGEDWTEYALQQGRLYGAKSGARLMVILSCAIILVVFVAILRGICSHGRKVAMDWNMFYLGILSIEIMLMTK